MTWCCKDNYLDLNVDKTREMAVDNRKKGDVGELIIEWVTLERVIEYKYIGIVLENKRLKLRSYGVSPNTLHMFYCGFIQSILSSCLVCWFGSLSVKNKGKFNSIINRGSTIVGVRQTGRNQLYETRAKRKDIEITSDLSHILFQYHNMLPLGSRLRVVRAKSAKY